MLVYIILSFVIFVCGYALQNNAINELLYGLGISMTVLGLVIFCLLMISVIF